jgi:large subunit ribosomal protein L13
MRTFMAKAADVERKWYVIDAQDKALGRVATEVARILRGKHKPIFTPHVDTGDFVIVLNAEKVLLTGNKAEQKFYYRHSGYPGGIKAVSYGELLKKKPQKVMELAVKGMLPHNKLGSATFKKLKVYAGNQHPHAAQKPENWETTS